MEDDLHKLAAKHPYRYQRSEDGRWRCPPANELVQTFGFSFRVCSSALLPRTYIDNLDFLTDYFISSPVIPEMAQEQVKPIPEEHV